MTQIQQTELDGVLLLEPQVFGDERGFFLETFRHTRVDDDRFDGPFVQHNHSRSRHGVLRGLHYQLEQPQGKLVRCARGAIWDVAVDIRPDSPNFGKYTAAILDDDNHRQLYVRPGFAHGFVVLSDVADVIYLCTDYYHPQSEAGIAWNDPEVGIDWPVEQLEMDEPLLSQKDLGWPTLADQERLPE